MIRVSKVLFTSLSLAAMAGTALAQDPPEGEGEEAPAEGEMGAEMGAEMGGEATADPAAMDPAAAAAATGMWPQEIINRPLTLNKGMIRAQADLAILNVVILTESAVGIGLGVGAGYGVSDKLEVGGSYAISLKEFEAKGPLSAYGAFRLMDGKMKAAAGASITYDLAGESLGLGLGLAFQYNLNEKMALFTPGNQLAIGLDPETTAGLNLPVGFGFQATPNIFAAVQTNIGSIGIEPSGSAFLFADFIPLTVGAFYSPSNKMDIGASISTIDLPEIADFWAVLLTGRIYMM